MDNQLFDFINRQQVYLEGVKNWHARDFNRYLKLLADAIRKLMAKLGLTQMGDLTKAKFNGLLRSMTDKVNATMGQYGTEILRELQRFSRIDLGVQRSAFAFIKPKIDLSVVKIGGVWSAVKDNAVAAFGGNLKDSAVALAAQANAMIRKQLTTSHVDNATVDEATTAIVGTDAKYTEGVLAKVGAAARGFVATAFQHVAATVTDVLGKLTHDCYMWVSVIDDRTTEVCRSRNGAVFRYGDGPTPPAHYHCRSRTVPVECNEGTGDVPGFFTWLKRQSQPFLADAFGVKVAAKVKAGDIKATDLGPFSEFPPLSIEEFELKAPLLTA